MISKNTKKRIVLGIIAILLLMACEQTEEGSLRMAGIGWPGYEPLYLANSLGILPGSIRMLEYPSASEVLRAVRNNNLEFAALTLDEVVYLKSEGFNCKIILVLDVSNGADVILSQKNIKKPSHLIGKKIGVEYTALGAYMLARFLEINHLKAEQLTIVPIELDKHEEFFINKQIDAIITFDPIKTKILRKGANLIFDSKQIPQEIIDVLIVREDIAFKNQKLISEIISSWYKTLNFIEKDFEKAAKLMRPRLKLEKTELKETFAHLKLGEKELNKNLMGNSNFLESPLLKILKKINQVMFENKIITRLINAEELILKEL